MRDTDLGLIDLFVDGKEDGLPNAGRLDVLGLGEGSVVFMLHRTGWCWTTCGNDITLGEDGLLATMHKDPVHRAPVAAYQLVTGGSPMSKGRHYWEVEMTSGAAVLIGAARPGLDHDKFHNGDGAFFIYGSGGLFGSGKSFTDEQGEFAEGDRIGALLDLDAGWMRFYCNGKLCGPGFTEGVTGPLVRAGQLAFATDKITVLPAVAPGGAEEEDDDEEEAEKQKDTVLAVVDYCSHSLVQLKDACRARGLPVGGTKAALKARLEAAEVGAGCGSSSASDSGERRSSSPCF